VPFPSRPQPHLQVSRTGHGPTWLFLHAAGSSGAAFKGIARRLSGDISLLTPELSSAGGSSAALVERPGIEHAVSALCAVVESEPWPLVVVGHSYGGLLALELARRRPELVERLVLIEPLALQLLRREDPSEGALHLQALTARVGELVRDGALFEAARLLLSYYDESAWAKLPEDERNKLAHAMPDITRSLREAAALPVGFREYAAVRTPSVVIRGSKSPLSTRWIAAQLSRTLPQAMLFEVAGAGHMSPITHPDEIAFLLRRTVLKGSHELVPHLG
jgi:pimeloyl-ACP methyl ester carboxylesterase